MISDPIETAKHFAARSLVELVYDTPSVPHAFDIEYEGVNWEVIVRAKSTEDGGRPTSCDSDFTGQRPE